MTLCEKIEFWGVVGTWLAGFATVAAVWVSLYLARTLNNPRIKARVWLEHDEPFVKKVKNELIINNSRIGFEIQNTGYADVTITDLGYGHVGMKKEIKINDDKYKFAWVHYPCAGPSSWAWTERKLKCGETVSESFNLHHAYLSGIYSGLLSSVLDGDLDKPKFRKQLRKELGKIRAIVYCVPGGKISVPLEKELITKTIQLHESSTT